MKDLRFIYFRVGNIPVEYEFLHFNLKYISLVWKLYIKKPPYFWRKYTVDWIIAFFKVMRWKVVSPFIDVLILASGYSQVTMHFDGSLF